MVDGEGGHTASIKRLMLSIQLKKTARLKRLVFIIADAGVLTISFAVAIGLVARNVDGFGFKGVGLLFYGLLLLSIKIPIFYLLGLYRFTWVFYSIRDTLVALRTCIVATLAFAMGCFVLDKKGIFPGVITGPVLVLDGIFVFLGVVLLRMSKRIYFSLWQPNTGGRKRLLIIGAGVAGEQVVRSLHQTRKNPYQIVGFIDDSPSKHRCIIHGVEVLGTRRDLPRLIKENRVEVVLVAIPSADSSVIRETVIWARHAGVQDVRTLPAYSEILNRRVNFHDVREVGAEDVLGRQPIHLDTKHLAADFKGKRVLVTGAAGSIGSELCRQVSRFDLAGLMMLDHEETGLFHLRVEMQAIASIPMETAVADIRDHAQMKTLFHKYRPHLVLHAAAYKHVGMMERQPEEAVKNNVYGTLNLGEIACETGVDRFVLISTDKAVNPRGMMGVTKRVAEMIGQYLNRRGPTRFVAVRFGNVLGSRGSVLPIFREQLKRGGPLTVTHPEMQRYFMIPSEAALLVLQSAVLGHGGEVLVLDMGHPVKILDLAKEVIRLANLEPDVDIPIVFTGALPEEKLHEDILTAEEGTVATTNDRIFRSKFSDIENPELFRQNLGRLVVEAKEGNLPAILETLQSLVPTYKPSLTLLSMATSFPAASVLKELESLPDSN
jgi:FlaA1/EpsC-like NDP-sugar epimerase